MGLEELGKSIKYCPPVIAQGSEPTIITRLALKDAMAEWRKTHQPRVDVAGGVKPRRNPAIRGASAPKSYDTIVRYTFIGSTNHRRQGSLGAAFIDWLIANPGATEADVKASGHDLKHLRWDLKENKHLLKIERR